MSVAHAARVGIMLAVGASLAACGASQQGAVPAASVPQSTSAVQPERHGDSWMVKGQKQRDLLYVSNANGTVSVYRYWQRTLVGVLTKFTQPLGECADPTGDVYITDYATSTVSEYAHGGTKPIRVLEDSKYGPYGCSVNPANGDLAVANFGTYRDGRKDYYNTGNIAVYPRGSGSPTIYEPSDDDHFISCAYDDHGDLFTTGENGYSRYYYTDFYYLPKHSSQLLPINLPGPSRSWEWRYVVGSAWDGKYFVVDSGALYRYAINVKAQYVDTVELSVDNLGSVAIYRKSLKSQGTQVVGISTTISSKTSIEYWPYPAGGSPIGDITTDLDDPYGVAISLGK